MVHFRVGELDGVSLEMDKWRKVLEDTFNHEVIYLAGSLGSSKGYQIPEFSLDFQPSLEIREKAFSSSLDITQEKTLEKDIRGLVSKIKPKIFKFIREHNIQCFIPNNMFSLPLNIPASLALFEVLQETGIPAISHNHDFTWERTSYHPSCSLIKRYLEEYYPPSLPNLHHAVINSIAQGVLKEKKNIESIVVPNVFYFEEPDWVKDDYNSDIRSKLKVSENDILILQATRLVERKGIELIIDLIATLNTKEFRRQLASKPLFDGRSFSDSDKIILIMPNLIEDVVYKEKLEKKCLARSVDFRFCNDFFAHQRSIGDNGDKIYNLWDIYSHSDVVSYPSLVEGWGNQFLEAVKAKLPVILYEYDVYKADIGPLGFLTTTLGSDIQSYDESGLVTVSDEKIHAAALETVQILQNSQLREETVVKNFEIGLQELSITALSRYIEKLLSFL